MTRAKPRASVWLNLALRRAGLQGERVQLTAHFGLERRIDELVLLHPRLAAEGLGDHGGGIVIAVPRQIADGDLSVRDVIPDPPLDLVRAHRHDRLRAALVLMPLPPTYRSE